MPFTKIGKKKRPMRRPRTRRPTGTKSVINLIKKVSIQQSEPKVCSQLSSSLTNPGHNTLLHNTTFYAANLLYSSQGVTANPGTAVADNRVGNEIYAKGLKIRLQLINQFVHPNVTYKVFIFKYPSGKTLNDAAFWVGVNGTGNQMNRMLDFVDTREVTVLKSMMIKTNHSTASMNQNYWTGTENRMADRMFSTYRDIWIPLNRKIVYDDNNSSVPKFTDIGMAILAYDVNNTTMTTPLGYVDYVSRLYFRDP